MYKEITVVSTTQGMTCHVIKFYDWTEAKMASFDGSGSLQISKVELRGTMPH